VTGTGDAVAQPTPWERRAELGLVQAAWQTWRETMLEPRRFWASVDPMGSAMDAFLYGWLVTTLGGLLQIPFLLLNLAQTQAQLRDLTKMMKDVPAGLTSFIDLFMGNPVVVALVLADSTVVLFPISIAFSAGLTHVGVRLAGGTERPFSTTVRAICYAIAPNVLAGVPVIGGFVGIYTLVLEVWGVRDLHRLTTGRAAIAVLWPLIFFCCCGVAGAIVMAASLASRL
jgi:hypothetical protein